MPVVDSHVHIWNAHPLDELLAQMEKAGVEIGARGRDEVGRRAEAKEECCRPGEDE